MGTNREGIRFIAVCCLTVWLMSVFTIQSFTVFLSCKIMSMCTTFFSPNLETGIIANLTIKKYHLPYESSFSYSVLNE